MVGMAASRRGQLRYTLPPFFHWHWQAMHKCLYWQLLLVCLLRVAPPPHEVALELGLGQAIAVQGPSHSCHSLRILFVSSIAIGLHVCSAPAPKSSP